MKQCVLLAFVLPLFQVHSGIAQPAPQWHQRNVVSPVRSYGAMTFDRQREVCVFFGGYATGMYFGGLWEWNGRQ